MHSPTAFTSRRGFPVGPMPELRLERAPLLTPEYRGQTPRATLHRIRRLQLALLTHHEVSRPAPLVLDDTADGDPTELRWTLASVLIIVMIVVGSIGVLA